MKIKTILGALLISFASLAAASMPVSAPSQQDGGGHAGLVGMADMGRPNGLGKAWTGFPVIVPKMGGMPKMGEMSISVTPKNIVANSIEAYSNDIAAPGMRRQLPLDMAGARLDKPAAGGFHWLTAREESGDKVQVASTVYYFSHPGKNPTAMFMRQKNELEIIPQPFPREHSRYRANEDWKFLVRFNGQPLPVQKVYLETRNGSKAELRSDLQGIVTVRLPDDFKTVADEKPGEGMRSHGRRSSDFVLATELATGSKTYLTAFNSSYGQDAFDQRSMAMGLGFTLLGMVCAVPLLRQRKTATANKQNGEA
ncbi:MAG TPA: hypothetical protein VFW53_12065 [Gallionella sp.]|nr:hypothetical protein [Gallionella sp.]